MVRLRDKPVQVTFLTPYDLSTPYDWITIGSGDGLCIIGTEQLPEPKTGLLLIGMLWIIFTWTTIKKISILLTISYEWCLAHGMFRYCII